MEFGECGCASTNPEVYAAQGSDRAKHDWNSAAAAGAWLTSASIWPTDHNFNTVTVSARNQTTPACPATTMKFLKKRAFYDPFARRLADGQKYPPGRATRTSTGSLDITPASSSWQALSPMTDMACITATLVQAIYQLLMKRSKRARCCAGVTSCFTPMMRTHE